MSKSSWLFRFGEAEVEIDIPKDSGEEKSCTPRMDNLMP